MAIYPAQWLATFCSLFLIVDHANAESVDVIDFECGGTHFMETAISANQTVVVGQVPAGLHRLAVHVWSDHDVDIQLMSGKTTVIHWKEGLVYHGEEKQGAFNGDSFVYSGYNGDGYGVGNEFIIFDHLTMNDYQFQVFANEDGHFSVRYGWIPLDSCNITEKFYSGLYEEQGERRVLRNLQSVHDQIDGHTELSYSACWNALRNADQNPSNSGQVLGFYTRRGIWKSYQDGSSSCGGNRNDCWNREHIYPKSRGDFGTRLGAGTDLHALRAADRSVNTERSNKNIDFLGSSGTAVPDCPLCKETSTGFEPPTEVKGEIARMLFYMAIRYNGDSNSNGVNLNIVNGQPSDCCGQTGYLGDRVSLKYWNSWYPPSSRERARNNMIQSWYQGNRNPFVDNPGLVDSFF